MNWKSRVNSERLRSAFADLATWQIALSPGAAAAPPPPPKPVAKKQRNLVQLVRENLGFGPLTLQQHLGRRRQAIPRPAATPKIEPGNAARCRSTNAEILSFPSDKSSRLGNLAGICTTAATGASTLLGPRESANEDAVRYIGRTVVGLGFVLFAIWLLTPGAAKYQPAAHWLGYFMLAQLSLAAVAGFCWFFCWAYERQIVKWYLPSVAAVLVAFAAGADRLLGLGIGEQTTAGFVLTAYAFVGTAIWCLGRLIVVRTYRKALSVVSEVGAAWRGNTPR
jgi:hypothetical protein